MRLVVALVAGVATAVLGALILGEYQLKGFTGAIAGLLFGLAVAEVVLTVGATALARQTTLAAIVVGVAAAAGVAWAGWISTGRDWGLVPMGAWSGVILGALAGPWWLRSGVARAAHHAED